MKRVLTLIFLISIAQQLAAQETESSLQFLETVHDFGDVEESGGPITQQFLFVNRTDRPVKILSVKASCGCTTPGWTDDAIAPGETGYVRAKYDPDGRPGYFDKSLTVTTDYDSDPIILQIKGQVVQHKSPDEYQVEKGSWHFKNSAFNMGVVLHHADPVIKEFYFYNAGKRVVKISAVDAPPYLRVEVPYTLEPGAMGKLQLTFFGSQRPAYGLQSDNITFHTDDPDMPLKSFTVYSTLEDDFSTISRQEYESGPRLSLSDQSFDFGRLKQGGSYTHQLNFTNTGRTTLEIRSIQGNCTCIDVTADPASLKPGATGKINITFNPGDRLNTQQKSVMIYSNDPTEPVQRILFNAYIED